MNGILDESSDDRSLFVRYRSFKVLLTWKWLVLHSMQHKLIKPIP